MHIDHIDPNGPAEDENLRVLCSICNEGRSNLSIPRSTINLLTAVRRASRQEQLVLLRSESDDGAGQRTGDAADSLDVRHHQFAEFVDAGRLDHRDDVVRTRDDVGRRDTPGGGHSSRDSSPRHASSARS